MRVLTSTAVKLGVIGALVTAGASFLAGAEKLLKIGYVTEMTGNAAYVAQSSIPAMEEHIGKINKAGGIGGYKLKLISYDTRNVVEDAIPVTKRLIDQDKCVALLGPSFSGAGIPMATIADASKCPIVATTASNINVTVTESGKLHPYMFRICFIDPYQGYALADYAYKRMNARRVAFLTTVSSPYSVGVHKFFEKHFIELGGRIVANEGCNEGDTEYRAQLAKIQTTNPDVIVASGPSFREAALTAQQARALGIKCPFMGADSWFGEDLLKLAGPELEGSILSSGATTDDPQFAPFNADFKKKFGVEATVYTYYGLDALMAVEHAVRQVVGKGGTPTRETVRQELEHMKDAPLFTSKVTIEPDTHNPHNKPILLIQVHNSHWKLLETFAPKD
jgi:branched-chain amino acid transport system substrate-binding protein